MGFCLSRACRPGWRTAKAEDAASTGDAIQIAVTAGLTTTVRMTPLAPVPLI